MGEQKALVIGSGGREHELARSLSLSDDVGTVYCAPGNPGIELLEKGQNVPELKPKDVLGMTRFALESDIDLTVIGPEAAAIAGVGDSLRAHGLSVFGPNRLGANLEGSKADAVLFMRKYRIAHPPSIITTSFEDAMDQVRQRRPEEYVIKADGEAGGKGAVLTDSPAESETVLRSMFLEGGYDNAGKDRVLFADRYHGPELSVFVVFDGRTWVVLPFSQDHKRLRDNDEGPNTGGTGAYSPVPDFMLTARQYEKIDQIVGRTCEGLSKEKINYRGTIYIGLMLAEELGGDPAVLEYNVRFGDPEAQVVLPLVGNVRDLLHAAAHQDLINYRLEQSKYKAALSAALMQEGYPDSAIVNATKGVPIYGLHRDYEDRDVIIHHAATRKVGRHRDYVTDGGRVLYVTGLGPDLQTARDNVYKVVEKQVGFERMQVRTDIGKQALRAA